MSAHEKEKSFALFMMEANRIFQEEPERAKKAFDDALLDLREKDSEAYFGCIRALQFMVKRLAPEFGADELAQDVIREKLAGMGFDA